VVRRQTESGLSIRAFCQQQQLREPLFYAWRRTIRERDGIPPSTSRRRPNRRRELADATSTMTSKTRSTRPAFVPLSLSTSDASLGSDRGIRLELRCGRTVHFPESIATDRLVAIIGALEAEVAQ
jgi:transposase-like protein